MRPAALILAIVLGTAACDKGDADSAAGSGATLDLDSNPTLLFYVFGDPTEVRMMPIAALDGNSIVRIGLPADGWRAFDEKYFRAGQSYPIYRGGAPAGSVSVNRGMWEGEPLYTLAGCAVTIPMAAVTLSDTVVVGYTIRQLALTRADSARPPVAPLHSDSIRAIAKRVGYEVGARVRLTPAEMDSLDFRAIAIPTHARERPTIVVSFIDPQGGDMQGGRGQTQHVFVVADDDGTGYKAGFSHVVNGDATRAEFRAYVDHVDVTGDGVDEIVIDGWRYGEETVPHILAWRNGTWRDVFTGTTWCQDPARR